MRRDRFIRAWSLLLAAALLLTGFCAGRQTETAVLDQQIHTGVVSLRTTADIPLGNLYLSEEQHSTVQSVQRAENTSKLQGLRAAERSADVPTVSLAVRPFGLARRLSRANVFSGPSWRAVTETIHRTRRRRRCAAVPGSAPRP